MTTLKSVLHNFANFVHAIEVNTVSSLPNDAFSLSLSSGFLCHPCCTIYTLFLHVYPCVWVHIHADFLVIHFSLFCLF